MTEPGFFTKQEIDSQPEAWRDALQVLEAQRSGIQGFFQNNYDQVIFTGCGSTYYLSLAAAALLQESKGITVRGIPASELWLFPQSSYPQQGRVLLVAVSRSGSTSETLHACEAFLAQRRGELVTLSCYGDQPLAKMGSINLIFPSGAEESVAQTRAFSTLYLGTLALAAYSTGREDLLQALRKLPEAARQILTHSSIQAKALGSDASIDRFYFLGSGGRYGLASELSLKMKEMTLSHSEPFHFMEFRHGPKSMVTPSTLLVGLVSESQRAQEMAVLDEMRALGGRVVTIGAAPADIPLDSGIPEAARGGLALLFGQMMAFERSISKGLNPDRPHNLDAVVVL